MNDGQPPLDGKRWGDWVQAGAERWNGVVRSWPIFVRNTNELMDLLNTPVANPHMSFLLMSEESEMTAEFWGAIDQRLHNQLASVGTLVDLTRRVLDFYEPDVPWFVSEFQERNARVRDTPEAKFLRGLRNYLLHVGVAPIVQTIQLGPSPAIGHELKLSAEYLLRWPNWSADARAYLSTFPERDGPPLARDVSTYANATSELFTWLFEQRIILNSEPNIPGRLRVGATLTS